MQFGSEGKQRFVMEQLGSGCYTDRLEMAGGEGDKEVASAMKGSNLGKGSVVSFPHLQFLTIYT